MTPDATYMLLSRSLASSACDSFDGHVLACLFAIGVAETNADRSLAEGLGLSGKTLRGVIDRYFPGTLDSLEGFGLDGEILVSDEEQSLRRLLQRSRSTADSYSSLLAILVARRAMQNNHLWQDLGLANRGELSALMQRHFASLALRNKNDMKWKKFFYRMICREGGVQQCVAPSCSECTDFSGCFGDESGESLLARIRLPVVSLSEESSYAAHRG
jgi:nitrogen fixation protein NifQ